MILKTITYSESKETVDSYGLKQWKKIGVEVEVEDSEDWEHAFSNAKTIVKEWHQKESPSTYFNHEQLPTIDIKER